MCKMRDKILLLENRLKKSSGPLIRIYTWLKLIYLLDEELGGARKLVTQY